MNQINIESRSSQKDPYRKLAERYDKLVEPVSAAYRSLALKFAPPKNNMRVLEVGCGTGTNLYLYQKKGCRVSGIDTSAAMLKQARVKLGEEADLREADAASMPYDDQSFDLAIAMLTLHEMEEEKRLPVLQEMLRVTGPDGRVLLIDYHPGPVLFPLGWVYKGIVLAYERMAGKEHFRNYRNFIANGGLPALVMAAESRPEKQKILTKGNLVLMVL